ncbi:unnamed protein product, partial [Symbiodinium necroappetens]
PKIFKEMVAVVSAGKDEGTPLAEEPPLKGQPRDRRLPAFWLTHPQKGSQQSDVETKTQAATIREESRRQKRRK